MKRYKIYILFLLCVASGLVVAQDDMPALPDLQMANQEFFDPTRKDKVKEDYKFSTTWRLEAGYQQWDERCDTSSFYLHGMRLGATVDFNLPYNFSIQTGALATLSYGLDNQHWPSMDEESAQVNMLQHHIVQLQLTIPARAYYKIVLWKQLRMFFYAGPQLQIGLTSYDIVDALFVSDATLQWLEQEGIPTQDYDRYVAREMYRTNIQMGVGGGLEWDRYRLQAGYDFGLNNILRDSVLPKQKVNAWGWMVSFSYKL